MKKTGLEVLEDFVLNFLEFGICFMDAFSTCLPKLFILCDLFLGVCQIFCSGKIPGLLVSMSFYTILLVYTI